MSGEHPALEITEVRETESVRVLVRGELDLAGVPALLERLGALRGRDEHVVLDLDELEFIDMSGLRAVRMAAEDASRDGWSLEVTRGSAPVRRLIELVRFGKELPLEGGAR